MTDGERVAYVMLVVRAGFHWDSSNEKFSYWSSMARSLSCYADNVLYKVLYQRYFPHASGGRLILTDTEERVYKTVLRIMLTSVPYFRLTPPEKELLDLVEKVV